MDKINIVHPSQTINCTINLPGSKSESNRALILYALSNSKELPQNLASARDTQTLIKLLNSSEKNLDVIDAGTTMRFLTAYFAAKNKNKILTGTSRMCERPIGILVDALREIGFNIQYLQKEGFPPIEILPVSNLSLKSDVSIAGDVSSQYISALLMIAPTLPNGLKIHLKGKITSVPYIEMTLKILEEFGVQHTWKNNTIAIAQQAIKANQFFVEADWSGASYWYSMAALASEAKITLIGLKPKSMQGDSQIANIMENFGVTTSYTNNAITITKSNHQAYPTSIDFSNIPDLAQTMAVICAAKNINIEFKGLESLKIKETNRIEALQNELKKCQVEFKETQPGIYKFQGKFCMPKHPIKTYDDHRMAMAFAPLALLGNLTIDNPQVVNKSYPEFWQHLALAGFVQL